MISIIVRATENERALARLLAALVPAAAGGLVREVAVLGAAGASRDVADDAGADLYPSEAFAEAVRRTRCDWVLGVPPTAGFVPLWTEALAVHLAREPKEPARLTPSGLFGGPEGWLVPKALAASPAGAREQDLQRLARRSGHRLRILIRG